MTSVEMPMRKVGGEQQQIVAVDMLHDVFECGCGWGIERLDRHAHVLTNSRQVNG